jgi:purine-binding chemotaxis protein CheW
MNLADIRKKAQKKTGDTGSPAVVAEETPDVSLPEQSEPLQVELRKGETTSEVRPSPVPVENRAEEAFEFDPLALILAGRRGAAEDEESIEAERGTEAVVFQELLCFRVSTEMYAINIMEIKEIIKPREITEVPRVPHFVSGILSLRGIIIPVFNMRRRLGLPPVEGMAKERIVVIKKGEELRGLLVDEVTQVVRVVSSSIEQPPAVLDGVDREFVSGIGRHNGMMLILLNLSTVLDVNLCEPTKRGVS